MPWSATSDRLAMCSPALLEEASIPAAFIPVGGVSSTTVATVGADWVWPLDLSGACWSGTSSPIIVVAMNMILTTTVALTALMRAATPALMRTCDCVQLQGVRRVSSDFTHVAS